jgi:ankyrin repeat protein
MVGLLMKAGADATLENDAGKTALDIARQAQSQSAAKALDVFALTK